MRSMTSSGTRSNVSESKRPDETFCSPEELSTLTSILERWKWRAIGPETTDENWILSKSMYCSQTSYEPVVTKNETGPVSKQRPL